jgi:hypothetical protein
MKKLTIPEIRHCMLALARQLEDAAEGEDLRIKHSEIIAMLRYLAEQTRRAPRSSRKVDDSGIPAQDDPPNQQTAGETRMKQHNKCVICGSSEWPDGVHNAAPVKQGQCCGVCNVMHVIPARIERIRQGLDRGASPSRGAR